MPLGFKGIPSFDKIKEMIQLSLPAAIQQFLFATGFTVLFWIIGQIGTNELAAANVLVNLVMIGILPAMSLGLTATTLVAQALGRKEISDAKTGAGIQLAPFCFCSLFWASLWF